MNEESLNSEVPSATMIVRRYILICTYTERISMDLRASEHFGLSSDDPYIIPSITLRPGKVEKHLYDKKS